MNFSHVVEVALAESARWRVVGMASQWLAPLTHMPVMAAVLVVLMMLNFMSRSAVLAWRLAKVLWELVKISVEFPLHIGVLCGLVGMVMY